MKKLLLMLALCLGIAHVSYAQDANTCLNKFIDAFERRDAAAMMGMLHPSRQQEIATFIAIANGLNAHYEETLIKDTYDGWTSILVAMKTSDFIHEDVLPQNQQSIYISPTRYCFVTFSIKQENDGHYYIHANEALVPVERVHDAMAKYGLSLPAKYY